MQHEPRTERWAPSQPLSSEACVTQSAAPAADDLSSALLRCRVVICGAGIIGASVAYYLSQLGVPSLLLERADPACAASGTSRRLGADLTAAFCFSKLRGTGKAGGFLAQSWLDGGPCEQLCRRSYALHAELAAKLGSNSLGYRAVTTAALSLGSVPAGGGELLA